MMKIIEHTPTGKITKEIDIATNKAQIQQYADFGSIEAKKEILRDELAKALSIEQKVEAIERFLL